MEIAIASANAWHHSHEQGRRGRNTSACTICSLTGSQSFSPIPSQRGSSATFKVSFQQSLVCLSQNMVCSCLLACVLLQRCLQGPRALIGPSSPGPRWGSSEMLGPPLPSPLSAAVPPITLITLQLGGLIYNVVARKYQRKGFLDNQVFKLKILWVLKAAWHLISPLKISLKLFRC